MEIIIGIETHLHNCKLGCQNCIRNLKIAKELYNILGEDRKNKNGGGFCTLKILSQVEKYAASQTVKSKN